MEMAEAESHSAPSTGLGLQLALPPGSSGQIRVTSLSAGTVYKRAAGWVVSFLLLGKLCRAARVRCKRFISGKRTNGSLEVCESRVARVL